jgi:membrane protease YdiL (CAAX protease family)
LDGPHDPDLIPAEPTWPSESGQPGEALPPQVLRPVFGAGKAALVVLLVFLTQVAIGIFTALAGMVLALISGENLNDPRKLQASLSRVGGVTLIASALATGAVSLLLARAWAWDEARDRTEDGLGLRGTTGASLTAAALAGFLLAGAYLSIARFLFPPRSSVPLGPLTKLAQAGGTGRTAWVVLALVLAPPIEEFLFRGLLFKGFSRSWGIAGGAITVTILFVLGHLFEAGGYWPAMVAILALAAAALLVRVRTGSLGPPVALHFAYNLAIVVYVGMNP